MPTPHVSVGARVFLTSANTFGEVVKTSILGSEAVVVKCDDGSLKAVCGEEVLDEVVEKASSMDGRGSKKKLPTDVRVIGPPVLQSFGVEEQATAALFQKFLVLDDSVRQERATYWEENKDDSEAMKDFLPELISLLGDDTIFIQQKSFRLLKHLDEETKAILMENMMTSTTQEQRQLMITEFSSAQNDKKKALEFVQNIFEMLLDNKTYIRMEFKKSLATKGILDESSSQLITTFLANSSDAEVEDVVEQWRAMKYYRSRTGTKYARNIVEKYSQ